MTKSLLFLAENQTTQSVFGKQYAGEWESYMGMKKRFFMLGKKNKYRDSNCFTMAGISTILSEMYLQDTTQKEILPMLQKVFPEVLTYATPSPLGLRFNFWKKLPPNRDLCWGKEPNPQPLVRRPTNFQLNIRYINNAANVEDDADDTAMGNLAVWYHEQIFGKIDTLTRVKNTLFDKYLDKNRQNRNWYNHLFHGFKNSGAYLTWLGQEAQLPNYNFLKTLGQNLTFFLPSSICYPHPYQPYIPWGTNDVDVVVNANILQYLTKTHMLHESQAYAEVHQFIENHVKRGRWNTMGVYYPNRYHLHYSLAKTFAAGDTALKAVAVVLLKDLLATQKQDGSFESRKRVNKRDRIQSSVYACLSLLYLKEAGLQVPSSAIDKSLLFLMQHAHHKGNASYWEGGVFFSGGTIVRSMLYFSSDAYTTALVALALQKYQKVSY